MDPGVILLLVSLQECTIDWLTRQMPAPPLKQWHILQRVTTRRHRTRGGVCYLRLRLHCCCTAVVQAAPKNPGLFYIHTWYKHLITRTIVKRKARIWRPISLTIFGVKREWKYATKVYVLRDLPGCQQAWKLFTDMHIVRENLKKVSRIMIVIFKQAWRF